MATPQKTPDDWTDVTDWRPVSDDWRDVGAPAKKIEIDPFGPKGEPLQQGREIPPEERVDVPTKGIVARFTEQFPPPPAPSASGVLERALPGNQIQAAMDALGMFGRATLGGVLGAAEDLGMISPTMADKAQRDIPLAASTAMLLAGSEPAPSMRGAEATIRGEPGYTPEQLARAATDRYGPAAQRAIEKRLGQDLRTPELVQKAAAELEAGRAAGKPLLLPDVARTNVQALAGALGRKPGESSAIIQNALEQRAKGAASRIVSDINRYVGTGSAVDIFEGMKKDRSAAAKPLFEKAFEGGGIKPLEGEFTVALKQADEKIQSATQALAQAEQKAARPTAGVPDDGTMAGMHEAEAREISARRAQNEVLGARAQLQAAQNQRQKAMEALTEFRERPEYQRRGNVWSARIAEFLENPRIQRGLNRGMRIEQDTALAEGRPVNLTDYAVVGFNDAGDPIVGRVPTMRLLAVAKEGLDAIIYSDEHRNKFGDLDKEGVAIAKLRDALVEELYRLNPDYKVAIDQWAGDSAMMDALREGQKLLSQTRDPDQNRLLASRMSNSERDIARLGLAQKMRTIARSEGPSAAQWKSIEGGKYGEDINRARIEPFFRSQDELDAFTSAIGWERTMMRTGNKMLEGSQTAGRQEETGAGIDPTKLGHAAFHAATGSPRGVASWLWHAASDPMKARWDKYREPINAEKAKILMNQQARINASALGGRRPTIIIPEPEQ